MRHDTGQTAAEYLGMIVVVGLILGALAAGAPGIGGLITDAIEAAICRITGDECGLDVVADDECRLSRRDRGVNGGVTVFSVHAGGELESRIDENSDGTFDVTLKANGKLGAEVVAGEKVKVGEGGGKEGASGAVKVTGDATISPTYTFESLADAEAFRDEAEALVTGPADDAWSWKTLIPIYGPGRIPINQYNRIRNFDPPDPTKVRVEGGVTIDAEGDVYGGATGVSGAVSQGGTLGADFYPDGSTTVYVRVDSTLAVEGGLIGGPSGNLSGDGNVVVGIHLGPDGKPVRLDVGATVKGAGGGDLGLEGTWYGTPEAQEAVGDKLAQAGFTSKDANSLSLTARASLDLTDPRSSEVANDFFDAIASGDVGEVRDSGGALTDHLTTNTDIAIDVYTGEESENGVEVKAGDGLAFGFNGGTTSSSERLLGAWRRDAGGVVREANC